MGLFTLQETHNTTKGKVQIEDFEIFEAIRNKAKGGTMLGAHKALKPFLIEEYSDIFELLVVEIKIANRDIRILTGYGPQENWPESERMLFFNTLEEEIVKSELAGKSIIVELDANSKLGPELIPGDMHPQSDNGKILADIITRHGLIIGNSMNQCTGLVTRKRITKNATEESIIDFILFSDDLKDEVEAIVIDDERKNVLTELSKTKNGVIKTESDHNTIFSHLKLRWDKKVKQQRIELFNLKNKECQEKFKEATTSVNNNHYLSSVFDEKDDLENNTNKFMKRLNKTIYKCFKKVRVKERVDKDKEELFNTWKKMKNESNSKEEFAELENELAEKYAKEYMNKIKDKIGDIECDEGGFTIGNIWKLKKEIFPQCREPPTAMLDPESGNLLTTEDKIEEATIKVYEKRLKNRPMKDNLSHIKDAKELLCEKILKLASLKKTPPWTMNNLNTVLKNLKKNKARDPYGFANELFMPGVVGDDLKLAILKLMNKIKDEQKYPQCLELCNISSIWKRKGPRNSFESYRGIFRVTIFRSILDRLIYNDEYHNIDSNLTDSNVGARKKRNIRDNIFVLNAILNSAKKEKEKAIDFQIYDIEKCFDSLWLQEVINSLYEAGLQNDKLPLLFLENNTARVAIKTNNRISRRVSIRNIIMQGSVWGSLCCVVLMDKLGKIVYRKPELLYYYKGIVGIPPLQMVDDILGIQKCSRVSLKLNAVIDTFMNLEKLKLSDKKCQNVHVGSQNIQCQTLKVNGCKMRNTNQEKYLGDYIDKSGSSRPNIEYRKSRGYGILSNIIAIINEVPLAHWKVQAGLSLRQAMLINGILFNSEAWHGVDEKDIMVLEKVDEALIRSILSAHPKIPLEALYLETKSVPIRFIVASRRIMYLHEILQRDEYEMVRQTYEAQKTQPIQGDFVNLVLKDCEKIGLKMTDSEIQRTTKQKFKSIVKIKVQKAAFEYLKTMQHTHTKMRSLNYKEFKEASYLSSPLFNNESRKLLLALRTRTVSGIRSDFGGLYPDKMCPLGCGDPDTLQNVLSCKILKDQHKVDQVVCSDDVKFSDIFSDNTTKQKEVTHLFMELLDTRNKILSQPVDSTGPVQSVKALQKPAVLSPVRYL